MVTKANSYKIISLKWDTNGEITVEEKGSRDFHLSDYFGNRISSSEFSRDYIIYRYTHKFNKKTKLKRVWLE
jgi:hypothetical protein